MPLPSEEFDEACALFAGTLVDNGLHWKDYYGAAYSTRMRDCIKNVRAACDEMEKVLNKDDERPVKELSPEEYEAKKEAGKKITWAVDQGKSPLKQEDDR